MWLKGVYVEFYKVIKYLLLGDCYYYINLLILISDVRNCLYLFILDYYL